MCKGFYFVLGQECDYRGLDKPMGKRLWIVHGKSI